MFGNLLSPYSSATTIVNLCDLPPWVIASNEFNEAPRSLHLSGVREANRFFFEKIRDINDPHRRGEVLNEYMDVKFRLHEWHIHEGDSRSSLRNSYVRFLRGWGVDSNSTEGAVLKNWVQSRFGLRPTYHRRKLKDFNGDDEMFALDCMKGMERTNAINSQFDLLYEFSQEELLRRQIEKVWLTLYRGTCDVEEYDLLETFDERRKLIRLNNLSSFTSDRELAWEFGSRVWKVQVPLVKIFFFSDLLPNSILKGENEYLVIGGEFRVAELIY